MANDLQTLGPQLCMKRRHLEDLPALPLPAGYTIRTSREGDGPHWARILRESFANDTFDESSFERIMKAHPAYRADRVFFACGPDGSPCGTASAYRDGSYGPDIGYVHYVGVCPVHAGKGLGVLLSLAVLRQFRTEGLRGAVLQTDDFRLPAIKTYLKLGFLPLVVHENQPARWNRVFEQLGLPAPTEYASL